MELNIVNVSWIACSFVVAGCSGPCSNEQVETIRSPSGINKAVIFSRDCGATTGWNTQVSVLAAAKALPDDGGNVLIIEGQVPLRATWKSESEIVLHGVPASDSTIFKRESKVAGLLILYE